MKRLLLMLLVTALGFSALADAKPKPKPKPNPTVKLANTAKGKILVTGSGYTLYVFSTDSKGHDSCAPRPGCLAAWPAYAPAKAIAGPGVNAKLLASIKLGSKRQVTYNGHPLYTFKNDFAPGSTDYVGFMSFGGEWDAINAKGNVVR